jgi:hypothetical protein
MLFLCMINDLSGFTPTIGPQVADNLALLKAGLDRLSKKMAGKGVQIIFQSQNPLLRDAHA